MLIISHTHIHTQLTQRMQQVSLCLLLIGPQSWATWSMAALTGPPARSSVPGSSPRIVKRQRALYSAVVGFCAAMRVFR